MFNIRAARLEQFQPYSFSNYHYYFCRLIETGLQKPLQPYRVAMVFDLRNFGLATVVMVLLPPFTRESSQIAAPRINFHHSWLFELTRSHS